MSFWVLYAIVLIVGCAVVSLPFVLTLRRWDARDRVRRQSPAAIPRRDLRSVHDR